MGTVCLNTLLEEKNEALTTMERVEVPPEMAVVDIEPNVLAQELYQALTENVDETVLLNTAVCNELLNSAKQFIKLIEDILEKAGEVIPVQALFVTPGDLLNHAANLTQVNMVNIVRD